MTMAYAGNDLLGIGIYSASEAAVYARVSTAKMVRWVLGTSNCRPAIAAQLEPKRNEDKWITFLDFIQTMAIRDIRIRHPRLQIEKVRETILLARRKHKIEYPFARKHTTFLLGNDIRLDVQGYGIIETTGPHKNQLNIRPVVERFLVDIGFDADGLAKTYTPFTHKGYQIVFNRDIRFGEPIVTREPNSKGKPCRYTVRTLLNAYDSEGGYEAAAKAYGVSPEAIEAAHKYFYDYLRTSDAA